MNNKTSRWIFFLIIILSLISIVPIRHLRFNLNFENYFSKADPEVRFYKEFQYQFQTEGGIMLIGLYNKAGIFKETFLKKTAALTNYLTSLEHIKKVYSLTNSNIIFFQDSLINARPLIHINEPKLYAADSVYLFQSSEYRDLLLSTDGKTIAVAAFHGQSLNAEQKTFLIERITNKLEELQFDKTHFVSKIKAENIFIEYLVKNGRAIALISFLSLAVLLLLLYRSFSIMLLLLATILLPILWILAIISLWHYPIDLFVLLLPLLHLFITIPAIIFISTGYIDLLKKGMPAQQAIAFVKKQTVAPVIISSLATAIAFFILGFSNIAALKIFSILAGLGLLLTCTLAFYLLPAFIPAALYANKRKNNNNNRPWERSLFTWLHSALKNKIESLIIVFLIAVASFVIITKVKLNDNLLEQVPRYGALNNDYNFMDNEFGGAHIFEVVLTKKEKQASLLTPAMLKRIEEIENFLKDSCKANAVISPVPLFKGANKAFHGGDNKHFQLPELAGHVGRFYEAIMQTEHADEMSQYMLADGSMARISGRLNKLAAADFKSLQKKLQRYFNRYNYDAYFSYQITGPSILLEKATKNITNYILISLSVAFFLCLVFSFLLLPSLSIILISFTNMGSQLLLMAAALVFAGINFNAGTAFIFSIAFTTTTAGNLHFFYLQKTKLGNGTSKLFAVKAWYTTFAISYLNSSILLIVFCAGFLFSGMAPIINAGFLLIASVLISILIQFILLPFLFVALYNKPRRFIS